MAKLIKDKKYCPVCNKGFFIKVGFLHPTYTCTTCQSVYLNKTYKKLSSKPYSLEYYLKLFDERMNLSEKEKFVEKYHITVEEILTSLYSDKGNECVHILSETQGIFVITRNYIIFDRDEAFTNLVKYRTVEGVNGYIYPLSELIDVKKDFSEFIFENKGTIKAHLNNIDNKGLLTDILAKNSSLSQLDKEKDFIDFKNKYHIDYLEFSYSKPAYRDLYRFKGMVYLKGKSYYLYIINGLFILTRNYKDLDNFFSITPDMKLFKEFAFLKEDIKDITREKKIITIVKTKGYEKGKVIEKEKIVYTIYFYASTKKAPIEVEYHPYEHNLNDPLLKVLYTVKEFPPIVEPNKEE